MTIPQYIAVIYLTARTLNMVRAACKAETPVKFGETVGEYSDCAMWLGILWWGGFWA